MVAQENRCLGGEGAEGWCVERRSEEWLQASETLACGGCAKEREREGKWKSGAEGRVRNLLAEVRNAVTAGAEEVKTNWIFALARTSLADNSAAFFPRFETLVVRQGTPSLTDVAEAPEAASL